MIFGRYLIREFMKIYVGLNCLFLGFYVVADFLENNTRYFTKYKASGDVIVEYYASQLPKIFVDSMPFTVLFASIICLWIFARNGEIAAIRAAGQSVLRLSLPLIGLGLAFAAASFLLGEFVIPQSQLRLRYVETVKIQKRAFDPMFLESKWVRGTTGTGILHFERYDPMELVLYNPQYYEFSSFSSVRVFAYGNRARFDTSSRNWFLENAVVTTFARDGKLEHVEAVPRLNTSVVSEPPRLLREGITSDQLSFRELRDLIRLSRKAGGNLANREIDLHQKLSMPFASLLFIFLTLPFALRKERQADAYRNIVFCLIAAVAYWVGNAAMKNLAQNGLIHPVLAAWSVNAIFVTISILFLGKLDRGD